MASTSNKKIRNISAAIFCFVIMSISVTEAMTSDVDTKKTTTTTKTITKDDKSKEEVLDPNNNLYYPQTSSKNLGCDPTTGMNLSPTGQKLPCTPSGEVETENSKSTKTVTGTKTVTPATNTGTGTSRSPESPKGAGEITTTRGRY